MIERQRRLGKVAATLVVGEKDLAAASDPFDRTTDPFRRPRDQDVLGIDEILRAEPAADIGRDKTQPGRLDPESAGRRVAGRVQALGRDMRGVAAARRIIRDDAARLHRVGDDAVVVEREVYDMRRRGEGFIDGGGIAGQPLEAQIARRFVGDNRGVGGAGCHRVGHGRQWRVVDDDRFGGVERDLAGLGDDQRDRLAGIADFSPASSGCGAKEKFSPVTVLASTEGSSG